MDKSLSDLWLEFIKEVKPLGSSSTVKVKKPLHQKAKAVLKPKNRNQRASIDAKKAKMIKKKGLKFEKTLDLHGLTEEQAYNKLAYFIENNWQQGIRNLLIITGKGHKLNSSGILRQMLPVWLREAKFNPMILHVTIANPSDGGEGAFYVVLRKKPVKI